MIERLFSSCYLLLLLCSIARTFETTVSVLAQQLEDRQRYLFVTENFVFLAELVRC